MNFRVKIDGLLSAVTGEPVIDLIWLYEELGRRFRDEYGPYDGKESMSEFITRKFGQRANDLTDILMRIPDTTFDDKADEVFKGTK